MASVGVRDLKAHLSAYVQRAAAGESIVITDHGKPVARLAPLTGASLLETLIDKGLASRATATGNRPPPHPIIAGPVSDLIADQRR
jgi:prevent-host-death family protein